MTLILSVGGLDPQSKQEMVAQMIKKIDGGITDSSAEKEVRISTSSKTEMKKAIDIAYDWMDLIRA